jgi:hypothetical protein
MAVDWRADGWHWRQQGTSTFQCEGANCKKFFFYTYLGKAEGEQVLSSGFKREAFMHPDYPLRVLVRYMGDSSVQVATVNTKTVKRRSRRTTTTNQSNNAEPSSSASNEEYCRMIATMESVNTPLNKSPGGSHYVFEADSPDKLDGIEFLFNFIFLKYPLIFFYFVQIGETTDGIGVNKARQLCSVTV